MILGAHVPGDDPLTAARERDAEVVQVFLSPPQSWKKPRERDDAQALRDAEVVIYVHAPYIINVATPNNRVRHPSRSNLEQTVRAAEAVGAAGVIVHGGHVGDGDDPAEGYANWRTTLDRLETTVPILIENTAGGDNAMARYFDRVAGLWNALEGTATPFGFCLDTCHTHAAGEDLADSVARIQAITGGIDLVHLNDSKDDAGSGRDRHENLGAGRIDPELLVSVVKQADAPVVLETPGEVAEHRADLDWIRTRL